MWGTRTGQFVEEERSENQAVLWILWGALVGSLCTYAAVGYLIRQVWDQPLAPETLSVLIPTFGGMALLITTVIFALRPVLTKQTTYQTYSIIRWALAEAVGILGFVLFVLGASWTVFGTFLGWAFLLELRLMPTQDDQGQFQRLKRQGWGRGGPQAPPSLS